MSAENIEIKVCLQKKLGSCASCQALNIVLEDPDARKRVCPPGTHPQQPTLKKVEYRPMGQK